MINTLKNLFGFNNTSSELYLYLNHVYFVFPIFYLMKKYFKRKSQLFIKNQSEFIYKKIRYFTLVSLSQRIMHVPIIKFCHCIAN